MAKPAPTEEQAEPPVKKKKTLLLIIIALVAVVLLAGVAVTVYLMTSKPAAEEAHGEEAEKQAEEHAEDESPPIYERLETFTVNLADQESYLQVEISLKVADAKVSEKIKSRMPEVRDSLLRLMSSKTAEELAQVEGKEALAKDVQKEINSVIGAKKADQGVNSVLFTAFIIQ